MTYLQTNQTATTAIQIYEPMSLTQSNRLSALARRVEGDVFSPTIAFADAPEPALRNVLSVRKSALDALTRNCGDRFAYGEMAKLALVMNFKSTDDARVEATLRLYAETLSAKPAFALKAACLDLREGRGGTWIPALPELCQRVDAHAKRAFEEIGQLTLVLKAKVLPPPEKSSPERRAEIAAMARGQPMGEAKTARELERAASAKRVRAMADEFLADNGKAPNRLPTPEEHAAEMARIKSDNTAHPIELSDRLKARLGQTA